MVGLVELAPGYTPGSSVGFAVVVGLASLFLIAAAAGVVTAALGTFRPLTGAIALIACAIGLGFTLLFIADTNRALPPSFPPGETNVVSLTEPGPEATFYPAGRFRPTPGGVAILSSWFGRVLVLLPSPNQVPWRLVQVTVLLRDSMNPLRSTIALTPAVFPWSATGPRIPSGYFPQSGYGVRSGKIGLVLSVERRQLSTILWRASQGGSRLFADSRALTSAGTEAMRQFIGEYAAVMRRPIGSPWFPALPPPTGEDQLTSWLAD